MTLTRKAKTRIFYTCMAVFLILFMSLARYSRYALEKNHSTTTAVVDEVKIIGRERYVNIVYHFFIDKKEYDYDMSYNQRKISFKHAALLLHRTIPVVYHRYFFGAISMPLIFPQDYKDFHVPFPDSLSWLLPLTKEGM